MTNPVRKTLHAFNLLLLLYFIGVAGYMVIEDYTLLEAFYMTTITLGTIGFSEVRPLSDDGRIFTIFLVLSGLTVFIYSVGTLTSYIIEGEFRNHFKGVKMNNRISRLKNHYIIAGYGRTGEKIVENFRRKKLEFIVIEKNPDNIEKLKERYHDYPPYILGDATEDTVLLKAGIEKASVLITVLTSDSDNLFTTMSAKILNPDVKIVARTNDSNNYSKMIKAGARNILSPYEITADRMFSLATDSNVLSFMDIVENYNHLEDLNFAKVRISETSSLAGLTLQEAEIPKKTDLVIIGVDRNGELLLNPGSHFKLEAGYELLVLGKMPQIKKLEEFCL